MKQHTLLKVLFVLIWMLALANGIAEQYHLYWIYRWFDIPMHFFGGVWVGLAVLWLCFRSGYVWKETGPPLSALVIGVVGGLLIGFVWEVYEFVVWQISGAGLPLNYVPDSLLDLVMDFLGSLVAYASFSLLRKDTEVPPST